MPQGNRANRNRETTIYFYDHYKGIYTLFSGIIVRMLHLQRIKFDERLAPHVLIQPIFPEIEEEIYKRSKHLKKWQKRRIVIDEEGLKSYRYEKCTL